MQKDIIGVQIKRLRIQQKKTQQELAAECGLSPSFISRIECSSVVPAIATLIKIAKALNSRVSVLIGEEHEMLFAHDMVQDITNQMITTNKGYRIFPFAGDWTSKKIQPLLYVVRKEDFERHFTAHSGEEFYYIIEGEIKLRIGDEVKHLKKGDGIYFNSSLEHETIPVTDEVCILDIMIE